MKKIYHVIGYLLFAFITFWAILAYITGEANPLNCWKF